MSAPDPNPTSAAEEPRPSQSSRGKERAPRYSLEQLGEYLGVAQHAVVGALAGSSKESFTIDEASKAVEEFYGREVSVEMAQPEPDPDEAEE